MLVWEVCSVGGNGGGSSKMVLSFNLGFLLFSISSLLVFLFRFSFFRCTMSFFSFCCFGLFYFYLQNLGQSFNHKGKIDFSYKNQRFNGDVSIGKRLRGGTKGWY